MSIYCVAVEFISYNLISAIHLTFEIKFNCTKFERNVMQIDIFDVSLTVT